MPRAVGNCVNATALHLLQLFVDTSAQFSRNFMKRNVLVLLQVGGRSGVGLVVVMMVRFDALKK